MINVIRRTPATAAPTAMPILAPVEREWERGVRVYFRVKSWEVMAVDWGPLSRWVRVMVMEAVSEEAREGAVRTAEGVIV